MGMGDGGGRWGWEMGVAAGAVFAAVAFDGTIL
jgi:hypothetical protein